MKFKLAQVDLKNFVIGTKTIRLPKNIVSITIIMIDFSYNTLDHPCLHFQYAWSNRDFPRTT